MPSVSVLMPVYNGASYLKESMESILNQSFEDYEFLIVNDGSTDESAIIIDSFHDSRVKHVKLNANEGIVNALNTGLSKALGEYIVRMDADDIALPQRIERQVEFMNRNSKVGIAGSWVNYFGAKKGIMQTPVSHEEILWALTVDSAIFHPSIIFRKRLIDETGFNYSAAYPHAEDYAMWVELSDKATLANIPEVLLNYRFTESSVSARYESIQRQSASALARTMHEKLLKRPLKDGEWNSIRFDSKIRMNIKRVLSLYHEINKASSLFADKEFEKRMAKRLKQLMLQRKTFEDVTFAKYFLMNVM
jgi:glycosyltransferase involved in cell wall biosynthesis